MKILATCSIILLLVITTGCGSGSMEEGLEYSGIIKPIGMTTYQYGTHTLEIGDTFYALRSDTIDLSNFENKNVTLIANRIDGYPVDGGPDYLEVIKILE